jgi:polyisoprenoid-binding protein YceI
MVDLRTLRTGIETRDEHMRERHLHTNEFPYAYFELQSLDQFDPDYAVDQVQYCIGKGMFFIHGVKRGITPDLEVVRIETAEGTLEYNVEARFSLKLDDYGISRPKLLFMKLAELIEIEIVLKLSSTARTTEIKLPDYQLVD